MPFLIDKYMQIKTHTNMIFNYLNIDFETLFVNWDAPSIMIK